MWRCWVAIITTTQLLNINDSNKRRHKQSCQVNKLNKVYFRFNEYAYLEIMYIYSTQLTKQL